MNYTLKTIGLITKTIVKKVNGITYKEYDKEPFKIYCNISSPNTSTVVMNNTTVLSEYYTIICYYNPQITNSCFFSVLDSNIKYEILGDIENIDMMNKYMRFKVRRIKGNAIENRN